MFYFHKVAHVHQLGAVDIFSYVSKIFLPLYISAKIIKIDRDFPKLWSQMYCHLFMVHSIHVLCVRRSKVHCSLEAGVRLHSEILLMRVVRGLVSSLDLERYSNYEDDDDDDAEDNNQRNQTLRTRTCVTNYQ